MKLILLCFFCRQYYFKSGFARLFNLQNQLQEIKAENRRWKIKEEIEKLPRTKIKVEWKRKFSNEN